MKKCAFLLLALLAGCGGCASLPGNEYLKDFTLRLQFGDSGICSGTKIGPNVLETARHCFRGTELTLVNDQPVRAVSIKEMDRDRVEVTLEGVTWTRWAKRGPKLRQGDRVRWWGNPLGERDVYREGYVAQIQKELALIDAPVCPGDSGSGLFNDRGELAGIVSAMTSEHATTCAFAIERRG